MESNQTSIIEHYRCFACLRKNERIHREVRCKCGGRHLLCIPCYQSLVKAGFTEHGYERGEVERGEIDVTFAITKVLECPTEELMTAISLMK